VLKRTFCQRKQAMRYRSWRVWRSCRNWRTWHSTVIKSNRSTIFHSLTRNSLRSCTLRRTDCDHWRTYNVLRHWNGSMSATTAYRYISIF